MNDDWRPKLGTVFPGQAAPEGSAARRFRETGFDLALTLAEQSPHGRGDKNYEGHHPQHPRGASTNMNEAQQTQVPKTPHEIAAEARAAGFNVALPMSVTLDQSVLDAMRRGQAPLPISQDLARFSAKAGIAAALTLTVLVAWSYITAPPVMDLT